MLRRVAFLALLVAMFSMSIVTTNGCGSDPVEVPATLIGFVKDDATGAAIATAAATLQSVRVLSDDSGRFRFNDLVPQQDVLVVEHRSYVTAEIPLTILPGESVIDVWLRRR